MTTTAQGRTAAAFGVRSITRKLLLVTAALFLALPAGAMVRYRAGIYYGYGPAFGPWGWYSPYYYGYGPSPVVAHPNAGEVKLDTKLKDTQVFINGAFAGTVGQLKSLWLRQGTYNFELRAAGYPPYSTGIYVVGGKTIRLRPDFGATPAP